jgi:phenylpropionate dioxygenase-like ring-hydroxylating dioxygenase large terminal subunit
MIKNVNYIDQEVFNKEVSLIFNSNWVYVCLTSQIPNVNDYVTYELGILKLVIHHFDDGIKCFDNICLHRFNKIQQGNSGNSSFFCKYHSWGYGSNGHILGQEKFQSELVDFKRDCLKQYQVGICGQFVFVKVNNESSQELENHLGEFFTLLVSISSNFDSVINKELLEIPHNANWKLLVENVLECYHCSTVHKETLVPIGIGRLKPENNIVDRFHDTIDYPISVGKKQQERLEKLSFLDKRQYQHKSLKHFYIFPNLFITSTDGILFYVGRLMPKSSDLTSLFVSFIKPKFKNLSYRELILSEAFYRAPIETFSKVIYEDKIILEDIQKNLPSVIDQQQVFGEEEFRIKNFHIMIKQIINY